jgi:hypothetical protein
MPNTSPLSSPTHESSQESTVYGTDLFDYSQDPLGFLTPSEDFDHGGINGSIPTQLVEAVLKEPTQTEPLDHYGLLEDAYNGLFRLFRKNESRLAQLSEENAEYQSRLAQLVEEHAGCKSRLERLTEENARLRYVGARYHFICSRSIIFLFRATCEDVGSTFTTLMLACGKAISVSERAREASSSNSDGASRSRHNASVIPDAGPSHSTSSPPFAPSLPTIVTPLLAAETNGGKGKGKKRALPESRDREETACKRHK